MNSFAWIGTDCTSASCEVQLTVFVILIIAIPFIIGGAILLSFIILLRKYLRARKTGNENAKRLNRNVMLGIAAVIIIVGLVTLLGTFLYERNRDQRAKNAGFTIYAPPGHGVDSEYLRQASELTVPHVNTTLSTPKGNIRVVQAATDNETEKLFRPPDKCDIDELYEYLGALGKESKSPTSKHCRLVQPTVDGWIIMTTSEHRDFGNRAPYAAMRGTTLVVFHAFSSTGGEFSGSPQDAKQYILDFLRKSQPVSADKL
jgi:hypothetical protein